MGRHAAPELDSPTEVIGLVPLADGTSFDDGAVDLVALVRNADRKTLRIAGAGVAALAAAICLPGLIHALPAGSALGSSFSSESSDPTSSSAYKTGVAYATSLRDGSGYDGTSILLSCTVHPHGYSGQSADEFQSGCDSVSAGVDYHRSQYGS